MTSYRIEVRNCKIPRNDELTKRTACKNMMCIPVFLIPGIEIPFRNLGLKHDYGNSR
jgi:hypothetical protein